MEEARLVEEPLVEETPPPEEAPLVAEPFVEETPPSEEAPPVEEQPLAGRNKTKNNTGQKQNKNRTKRNKKAKQTNTTKHNQNKIKKQKTKQDKTRNIYMFFAVKTWSGRRDFLQSDPARRTVHLGALAVLVRARGARFFLVGPFFVSVCVIAICFRVEGQETKHSSNGRKAK